MVPGFMLGQEGESVMEIQVCSILMRDSLSMM